MNDILRQLVYKLLYPIVKILLRKGISFGEFNQTVKLVFTDVAEQILTESEGKASSSRISIITGLTRKDVGFLRKQNKNQAPVAGQASQKYNRSVRVISGWIEDNEFCSDSGYPRTLPIHGETGSFESLVNKYSGDMPVRAMLDELLRVGVVEKIESHHVSLLRHAYIPEGDEDEKLLILGEDVPLLITTIDHNLAANKNESRFQRKVCYNNLPEGCLADFKKMVDHDGQLLLEKFNEWLSRHDRDNASASDGSDRFKAGVGIYYFQQAMDADSDKQKKETNKANQQRHNKK